MFLAALAALLHRRRLPALEADESGFGSVVAFSLLANHLFSMARHFMNYKAFSVKIILCKVLSRYPIVRRARVRVSWGVGFGRVVILPACSNTITYSDILYSHRKLMAGSNIELQHELAGKGVPPTT